MPKTLLATLLGVAVLAAPAFAQVIPGNAGASGGANGSAQTGAATGTAGETGTATAADASGTQALGLGGLLKQVQAGEPSAAASSGSPRSAGETLRSKVRAKAHAAGH